MNKYFNANDLHAYKYEWIDDLSYVAKIEIKNDSDKVYNSSLIDRMRAEGWDGNGEVGIIWIPPFAIGKIIKGNEDLFFEKFDRIVWHRPGVLNKNSWTKGVILYHAKNKSDGLSILLSPVQLDIASYGLID